MNRNSLPVICGSLIKQDYRKVPKFSDTRKLCCDKPKIQEKRQNLWVFRQEDANGIANSGDPDLWVCTVCRVATVREKSLENEIFSRSGKSQGISMLVREI